MYLDNFIQTNDLIISIYINYRYYNFTQGTKRITFLQINSNRLDYWKRPF